MARKSKTRKARGGHPHISSNDNNMNDFDKKLYDILYDLATRIDEAEDLTKEKRIRMIEESVVRISLPFHESSLE